jgi:hypothetical protein
MVIPGPDSRPYILSGGQQRHTYFVLVRIYEMMGGDLGEAANTALPMVDRVIEAFTGNVLLADADDSNPRANSCTYTDQSGLQNMIYTGREHLGYEIRLEVSEQATATPAAGS